MKFSRTGFVSSIVTCTMFFKTTSRHVRGKTITVTPDSITKLIDVRHTPNPYYAFPNPNNIVMHKDDVTTTLCGRETEWNSEVLYTHELIVDYRILNIFVCHTIEPRGETSDIYYSQAYLLYATGMGLNVDIP